MQRKTFARRIYVRAKISHLLCKWPPIVYAHLINSFIVQTAAHSIHTRPRRSSNIRAHIREQRHTDRQTDKLITSTSQTLRVGELIIHLHDWKDNICLSETSDPFLITAQVGLARRQYRGYFRFNRGPGGYPGVAWALTGSGTDPMLIYFT